MVRVRDQDVNHIVYYLLQRHEVRTTSSQKSSTSTLNWTFPKMLRNQLVVAKVMFESRPLLAHSLGTFFPFFGSFRKVAIPVSLQMEKMKVIM